MGSNLEDVARALPDYEVGDEVGRGAYGIVFSGRHRQLGRPVAVKQLAGAVTTTADYQARFRREARILAQVDHPHVVTVYDYREHDELRLLVMELLSGGTFADRRAAGMSMETAIASTLAAASGLHHVHEQGILHRDVKPENLMFDRRSTLKVTDFGIARSDVVDGTVINLTQGGEFFGTPAYVAPEQAGQALADGWPAIGATADQYSLAAMLYETLSGQLTHDGSGGVVALCLKRMNEEARPLHETAPAIPSPIDAVVMKALARDPSLRYATTEEFAVALATAAVDTLGSDWLTRSEVQIRDAGPVLDAALGHRVPPPATAAGVRSPAADPPAPPAPPPIAPPDPATAAGPARPRRRTGLMALGFVVVLVGALAAFLLLNRGGSDPPTTSTTSPSDATPTLALTEQWAFTTGDDVFSSPAVANDLVVAGSDDGSVYAIDAATGTQRWKRPTGGPVRSSPVIDGDRVFVGSNDGTLYALDLATGAVDWKTDVGYEIVSSPAVSGGSVVVGSDRLYAFDTITGAPRWAFATTDSIVSSPAIDGDTVVVGSNDHHVYGVGLSDGTERWRVKTGDAVQSSPAIADGVVFVGGLDGMLYAIDVASGARRWTRDIGVAVKSSPAASGGQVFVGTDAGKLLAFDAATGDPSWTFVASDRIDSSPVVLGGLVVVGSNDGTVYAIDAKTGKLGGSFTAGGPVLSSPQVAGDGIVVGSYDDIIYRVEGFTASTG